MTISIGRVGLTAPTLNDPTSIQFDGDQLQISGITAASTVALGIVLRDQIRGLNDNVDEPTVPIAFSGSTYDTYEGLYRIESASSSMEAGDGAQRIVRWQITATRIQSYQAPFSESRIVVNVLSNAHSITSTNARGDVGAPQASEVYPQSGTYVDTTATPTSADGTMLVMGLKPAGYTTGSGVFRYSTTLANWYVGGCTVSSVSNIVIGRQAVDSPTTFSMQNGLIRVTASASTGQLDVEHYDGSAWDTAKTYKLNGSTTAGDITAFHHMAVLRNGIECVTVRVGLSNGGGVTATADITIRRGSRWVNVLFTSEIADTWGIKRSSVEAATAVTGGIRATSNDASGNRYLLAIPTATTNDLVNGAVRATSALQRVLCGIGSEVGGSGASSPFTAQLQVYRFIGQTFETTRVVGR